jgi:glycosyltransferase involved in cell wall biosynthesis
MRILFLLAEAFVPEHYSGQTRTLFELCRKLTALGHELILLTGKSNITGNSKIVVDREYGFRIFRAANPVESIAPLCTALSPDIAVVIDGKEKLVDECRRLDVPLAAWLFEIGAYAYSYSDHLCDNTALYMVSSPFLASRLYGVSGIRAQVVVPYIEKDCYHKSRQGKRVLFVNPVREKGLEIAYQLAQQRPELAFTVVESRSISGEWRAVCFNRALRCGNVEWCMAGNDMDAIYGQTRLLLMPRFHEEGFCRLVTEAQLGGIPVLAADRGYLADNVGAGGKVIPVDADIRVWLEQLDRFMTDESFFQEISEHAKIHASRDELNGERMIGHLLTLLTGQISKHRLSRFAHRYR